MTIIFDVTIGNGESHKQKAKIVNFSMLENKMQKSELLKTYPRNKMRFNKIECTVVCLDQNK